uniref:Serpentine Receptor, class E (Epsilon) n=1 Tax=Rhabditophanes sp. KR3021 TaxID=114890 RepID=A0AC35TXQ8_9BILA
MCMAIFFPTCFQLAKTKTVHNNFRFCFYTLIFYLFLRAGIASIDGISDIVGGILNQNIYPKLKATIVDMRSVSNHCIRFATLNLLIERTWATLFSHKYENEFNYVILIIGNILSFIISLGFYLLKQYGVLNWSYYGGIVIASNIPLGIFLFYIILKTKKMVQTDKAISRNLSEKYQEIENMQILRRSLYLLSSIICSQIFTDSIFLSYFFFTDPFGQQILGVSLYAIRDYSSIYGLLYFYYDKSPYHILKQKLSKKCTPHRAINDTAFQTKEIHSRPNREAMQIKTDDHFDMLKYIWS